MHRCVTPAPGFARSPDRSTAVGARIRAYTLIELLIVIGLLILLIGLLAPGLQIARPSKAAIGELKSVLDRARSEAVRHRTDTFVAFTDSLPNYEGSETSDAFRYRQYAIFIRDTTNLNPAARYFPDVHTCPVRFLQKWRTLPDGVMFALARDIEWEQGENVRTLLDSTDPEDDFGYKGSGARVMPLRAVGVAYPGPLPCIAFDREGKVRLPIWDEGETLYLGLVEGTVTDGQRVITKYQRGRDRDRVPVVDLLTISRSTGRVREVGVSATSVE